MDDLTLVFDLDGTLVDTAPDLVCATNHVLADLGEAPLGADTLRPLVSFGARRMIEHALNARGIIRTVADVDRMLERFLAFYAANIAVESRPFDGIVHTLDLLASGGVKLAVCTNKREDMSRLLLSHLGLADRFATICGRDTFPVCKPHPDHLLGTIARAGGRHQRAVMVGDSDTDVRTARAAGVAIIGVSFGYTDVHMRELGPDALIDHYDEFQDALAGLLSKRA